MFLRNVEQERVWPVGYKFMKEMNLCVPLLAIVHALHFGCDLCDFILELLQKGERRNNIVVSLGNQSLRTYTGEIPMKHLITRRGWIHFFFALPSFFIARGEVLIIIIITTRKGARSRHQKKI